jgi:hypothetical protein
MMSAFHLLCIMTSATLLSFIGVALLRANKD